MGGIVTRNMYSKAIAKNKRNCCILLDLFHYLRKVSEKPAVPAFKPGAGLDKFNLSRDKMAQQPGSRYNTFLKIFIYFFNKQKEYSL